MAEVSFATLPCGNGFKIGVVTLDAQARLNALNESMVVAMYSQLCSWRDDADIAVVWLQGAGEKAFCAGGDVKGLQQLIVQLGPQQALSQVQGFFENEYRLDYLLHKFPKPVLVWGHGVVMGGGLGLLVGGSHRIVTENARLAMPEITIGLYPDVGGTYFLPRMPGKTGLFAGLTGAVFGTDDALFLGLADYCLPASSAETVLSSLQAQPWSMDRHINHELLNQLISSAVVESGISLVTGDFRRHAASLESHMQASSMAELYHDLMDWQPDDPWLVKALATLRMGSPLSAHLIFEQFQRGQKMELAQAFQTELIMSLQCALHQDFREGVRALLVDKDRQPKWQFASVVEVPEHIVSEHFLSPWPEGRNPLLDLIDPSFEEAP